MYFIYKKKEKGKNYEGKTMYEWVKTMIVKGMGFSMSFPNHNGAIHTTRDHGRFGGVIVDGCD